MIYAGTTVNVENARRTKREDFIARFLPQLVFFAEIPIEDRETELGKCWDMCQESDEDREETIPIPEAHLKAIQEKENEPINKGTASKVGSSDSKPKSNNRSNKPDK